MTAGGLRVGIDIGGTKTHAVALAGDGAVASEVTEATTRGAGGLLEGIRRAVGELAHAAGADVGTIGIGMPGQVDVGAGVVRQAINLGVERWDVADAVQSALGVRPRVDNDVNVAALGARQLLGIEGSMAYLNLGTGVAAGIVFDGRLVRGSVGAAGEVGHISVDPAGPLCDCGQRGCIEAVAGGPALARAFPGASRPVTAMFDGVDRGDPHAIAVCKAFAHGVASAVQVLLLTVDVDRVIVGGGLASSGQRVETTIRDALVSSAKVSPFLSSLGIADRVSFLPASLRAPAIGAALLGSED